MYIIKNMSNHQPSDHLYGSCYSIESVPAKLGVHASCQSCASLAMPRKNLPSLACRAIISGEQLGILCAGFACLEGKPTKHTAMAQCKAKKELCLLEHAILVADAVAPARQVEGGHGVQEAGCQAAQASISQRCVLLRFPQRLQVIPASACMNTWERPCETTQRMHSK